MVFGYPEAVTIVSLFSGAMGLDIGLEQGIAEQFRVGGPGDLAAEPRVVAAVEANRAAQATIRRNAGSSVALFGDVCTLSAADIVSATGVAPGGFFLVSGGPPCQPFSTAGHRHSLADPRGSLFIEYVRLVRELQPRFFVMENVRGLLSAAIRHRPLRERGSGFPPLSPEELRGSAFAVVLEELGGLGYRLDSGLLNAAAYGVPQKRERLVIIGSRDGEAVSLPAPTHGEGLLPFVTVREAWAGLDDPRPEFPPYPPLRARYLALVPPGGNWRDLPPEMQQAAMGGAYTSGGGKVGFYRRLSWERPAPTVTTSPAQKATEMCHPEALRPISVREAARLQQFPDDWFFAGGLADRYRQIGNAVPVGLGRAVGRALMAAVQVSASAAG